MTRFLLILLIFAFTSTIQAQLTARKIYFTTTMQSGGPDIEPGFKFNYFWSGSGMGPDGCVYGAASSNTEQQGGGDCGVGVYNPYTNQMKSAGTVTKALVAAGNRYGGETCNKVHTWLTGTPDGKVWLGTEDGGRGGHLMYVDVATGRLKDYSRYQKFIYAASNQFIATQNYPQQPISALNGVSVQDYSFKISGHNPGNPRYLWTESYPNYYFQVWDLWTDSTRAFPGGHRDLRAFVVDKQGSLYYINSHSGTLYRRSRTGQLKAYGSGFGPPANTYIYSHSFDTAYTMHRQDGIIVMYDFVNDNVRRLADMPDGSGNTTYRAMAISRDGLHLYVLGNGGRVYDVSVPSGSYTQIGNLSSHIGSFYAMSSGLMDTLGNWYITCNGSNGNAYFLQVHLGKDKITMLPFPNTGIDTKNLTIDWRPDLQIMPNPFKFSTRIMAGPGQSLRIYDLTGRLVTTFKPVAGSLMWDTRNVAAGPYIVVSSSEKGMQSRKVFRLP